MKALRSKREHESGLWSKVGGTGGGHPGALSVQAASRHRTAELSEH